MTYTYVTRCLRINLYTTGARFVLQSIFTLSMVVKTRTETFVLQLWYRFFPVSVWNTDGMIIQTQFFITRLAIRICLPRQIELHCATKPDLFDLIISFFSGSTCRSFCAHTPAVSGRVTSASASHFNIVASPYSSPFNCLINIFFSFQVT